MSLNVSAYYRGNNDKVRFLDRIGTPSTQAGFESYRKEFYGSNFARSQGCVCLPELATGDIYAEGARLEALERDVLTLLDCLPALASELGKPGPEGEEHFRFRLQNILNAIMKARKHPSGRGGVHIG